MKKTILLLFAIVAGYAIHAQQFQQQYPTNGTHQITVVADYPNVHIFKSSASQIEVKAYSTMNGEERTDIMEFDWDAGSQRLEVTSEFPKKSSWKDSLSEDGEWGNWNFESRVDVYVPAAIQSVKVKSTYGRVDLDYLTASVNVDNTYGTIHTRLTDQVRECILTATYSEVILMVDPAQKADVRLETHYGEILTNTDLDIDTDKSEQRQFKHIIYGTLNQGGTTRIELRSDYGNVILKKVE